MDKMFCRQCEQTNGGKGCTLQGVCGKTWETSGAQDALIHSLKGLGFWGKMALDNGVRVPETDAFVEEALFTTITNVNFDPATIEPLVRKACALRDDMKVRALAAYKTKNGKEFSGAVPAAAEFKPAAALDALVEQGRSNGILTSPAPNEDVRSLRELILFGLKGMAAYADHARVLGKVNPDVDAFFYKGLAAMVDDSLGAAELVPLVMELGQVNLKCMETLDAANTGTYGHPEPTQVSLGHRKGPAILISGHDLRDLYELLQQTEGKGINIYTHGEMLPANAYPGLKKFSHLAGHFGTAWQNQYKEFAEFPGAMLMTTNCIQRPANSYVKRIFTTGLVQWPGVTHIDRIGGKKDFSPVIKAALEAGGFPSDEAGKKITIGFGHDAVMKAAGTVVDMVKKGRIKHFFLIGGCDGAKPGRNYYTEFAQKTPRDTVILTLACGKFRFNTLDHGEIDGLPRLLDCGQCNDSYSAIVIASALAKAFGVGVNELPLSLILSWYEQKAVCVLITLLSLGIKNIRLGPTLPAFVSPNVLKVLVDNFGIKPIETVDKDMQAILSGAK